MGAPKSIDYMTVAFDERKMALELTVDPKVLPGTTVDLSAGRKQAVFYPTNANALFNYDLSYAGANAGQRDVSGAATELGARVGDFLLLSDSTYYGPPSEHRFVRLMNSLIHDDRDTSVRTVLGDFVVAAGHLSSSVGKGGVSYASCTA